MVKILVDQCDRCRRSEDIVLRSKDDKHCLCGDCIKALLEMIINPSQGEAASDQEVGQTMCAFCGKVSQSVDAVGYDDFYIEVSSDPKDLWICGACVLEAAREVGNLRVHRDC